MHERLIRCHLIASIIAADGIINADERVYLENAMETFGLSPEERDAVRHFEGADEALAEARKLPLEARRSLIDELVGATLTDALVSSQEMQLVQQLSKLLCCD